MSRMEELKRTYRAEKDAEIDTLVAALCETYKDFTGKEPTNQMLSEFDYTVRFSP